MPRIRIKRKGYSRKGYRRTDGTWVKKSRVGKSIFYRKSPHGRVPESKRFFKPVAHTGWSKLDRPDVRRANLMATTDRRMNLRDRWVQAGRRAQYLANVSTDFDTSTRAQADANYFFGRAGGR